jgi:hypothetical protein
MKRRAHGKSAIVALHCRAADGSALRLSLSDTPEDRETALAAWARCDLRDAQQKEYFRQVRRMAKLRENMAAVAFHVLQQPKFKISPNLFLLEF